MDRYPLGFRRAIAYYDGGTRDNAPEDPCFTLTNVGDRAIEIMVNYPVLLLVLDHCDKNRLYYFLTLCYMYLLFTVRNRSWVNFMVRALFHGTVYVRLFYTFSIPKIFVPIVAFETRITMKNAEM